MGAAALLELSNILRSGYDVLLTPDGPRGPAYELGPGIIFLAQKTGAPVVPINMEYSSCWRVRSWEPVYHSTTVFESTRHYWTTARRKIDIYA